MNRLIAVLLFGCSLIAATAALSQSFNVQLGGRKGPTQPINYSHQTHAGKLQMDCRYCHYGATRSSFANLPAVSTCMGCHKIAVTDRPEIQKLTGYWERGEQIPWVKVHYLPDHVKFNHKRHIKAGIICQDCHGPIQEMPVVYQYNSLKMGWCLECHRKNLDNPTHPASMDCVTCHH